MVDCVKEVLYSEMSLFIHELCVLSFIFCQIDLTCKGTQGPGSLFVNLFVIVGLIMLI